MDCVDLVELVTAYLDDALDGVTRARFEEHIDECSGCAAYLEQIRETIALLGALDPVDLSGPAVEELRTAFRSWAG